MKAPRYIGHNPAGGTMIIAILSLLAVICVTGWLQLTQSFFGVAWVEKAHHWAATIFVYLIPLHVFGAIASSLLHRENLIGAMITGMKPEMAEHEPAPLLRSREELLIDRLRSSEALALLAILVAGGVTSA